MRDSDDDDYQDRDYDVAALANNLSQAFRYGIYSNDDMDEVLVPTFTVELFLLPKVLLAHLVRKYLMFKIFDNQITCEESAENQTV